MSKLATLMSRPLDSTPASAAVVTLGFRPTMVSMD